MSVNESISLSAFLFLCQGSSYTLQSESEEGKLWEPYLSCLSNEEINAENVMMTFYVSPECLSFM